MVVLLNDEWYNAMVEFGYSNSKTLWVKFRFRVEVYVVLVCSPTNVYYEERK